MVAGLREGWELKRLDELGSVARGRSRHRPRDDSSLYGGSYPFIQTGDVKAADLYITRHTQSYNEVGLAQSKLWNRGTLCITIAANIADTAILKYAACFPDSVVGFIPNQGIADVHFVKYTIDTIKLQMQNISRGTTQDNLSVDKLLTFRLPTPPLDIQRRIAGIVSAYDDLIWNNKRRIAALEETARSLYHEWFVNFRFPGHEHAEMVDSPLGQVPRCWSISPTRELVELVRSTVHPLHHPSEEFEHYSFAAYDESRLPSRDFGASISSSKFRVPVGTILLAKLNPRIPRVWMPDAPGDSSIASTEFLVCRPRESVSREYCFALLESPEFADRHAALSSGTSTSHQRVKPEDFLRMTVVVPPRQLISQFTESVAPMYALTSRLRRKDAVLRKTRDLLLPRLISGELDVSGLDIDTGELSA